MKKRFAKALVSLAALGTFASSASAAWYEGFDYTPSASATSLSLAGNVNLNSMDNWPHTNGPQTGGNTWTSTSTPAVTNDTDVLGGSLNYTGLPWTPTGNRVGTQAASQRFNRIQVDRQYGTGDGGPVVYYSMLVRVSDMGGMTNNLPGGGFFTGLQYYPLAVGADSMSATSAGAAGPITIRWANQADVTQGYELGVAFRDAPNSNRVWGTTDYTTADRLFCVVKMEFNNIAVGSEDDRATLWVFRDDGVTPDVIPLTEPGTFTAQSTNLDDEVTFDFFSTANPLTTNVRSIIVRGGTTSTPNGLQLDEIRVSNNWADVVGVPEPTGLALLGLGAIGMLRRRK